MDVNQVTKTLEPETCHVFGQVKTDHENGKPITRLSIPAGERSLYRIAQLDDYFNHPRRDFQYSPPVSLSLDARVSANGLPGTWGFGFWNDPFSAGIGIKGSGWRLPTFPQAAWFFYGSSANDLSFNSNNAANGLMASVFASPISPSMLLTPVLPGILLLPIRPAARLIRRFIARYVRDEFQKLDHDASIWHTYHLSWLPDGVRYIVDGSQIFSTLLSPRPPLGLVIWIDNQFAAFSSKGCVSWGMESNNDPTWLEIKEFKITQP